jgi:hypothetical protein
MNNFKNGISFFNYHREILLEFILEKSKQEINTEIVNV